MPAPTLAEATPAPPAALVHVQDLTVRFAGGTTALQGINLALHRGEFASIVGPSGCGKSTLLRLVAGLLEPTEGSIRVQGLPAAEARRLQSDLSFVFQQPTLLPWRTVEANVRLPLELRRHPRAEAAARVQEVIELVGLGDFRRHFPHQLSGGMQMRVSIARALVTRPQVLLMDEPFAALDDITRQRLNEELLALWERDRFTALFVTHNVQEAAYLSQRILVMSARPGHIVEDDAVPFPSPRPAELRSDGDFARFCGRISAHLRAAHA